jgi:hypothetical protein
MAKSNPSKSMKPKAEEAAAPAKQEAKPTAAKPSAAPKAVAVKGKKVIARPTPGGAPVIDTSLAASNAAKLLVNRNMLNKAGGEKPESAGFRQMKESLSKPAAPSVPFLPTGNTGKKSNQPFGDRNQVGHNQTFGADVNRSGVPRRTGGG